MPFSLLIWYGQYGHIPLWHSMWTCEKYSENTEYLTWNSAHDCQKAFSFMEVLPDPLTKCYAPWPCWGSTPEPPKCLHYSACHASPFFSFWIRKWAIICSAHSVHNQCQCDVYISMQTVVVVIHLKRRRHRHPFVLLMILMMIRLPGDLNRHRPSPSTMPVRSQTTLRQLQQQLHPLRLQPWQRQLQQTSSASNVESCLPMRSAHRVTRRFKNTF